MLCGGGCFGEKELSLRRENDFAMEYEPIYGVGTASFEEMRRSGCVYVDKTEYVWRMAHTQAPIFLARPRRFGKSLLTDTLECYFRGRRELFEGLRIAEMERDWAEFPVLRFDLSRAKEGKSLPVILDGLYAQLREYEGEWGVSEINLSLGERLSSIIRAARKKAGRKVVVLVDEYDAPLNNNIDKDEDLLGDIRSELRSFFGAIKSCGNDIRFAFLTGITRYSQMGLFSGLNNLENISIEPEYAGVCGITQEELETVLRSDVERLACKLGVSVEEAYGKLKHQYDGYHFSFDSPDIYSPFSLFKSLHRQRLENHWFGSATPSMLIMYLTKMGITPDMSALDGVEVSESSFNTPLEDARSPLPILYQSGYLTIRSYDDFVKMYTLCIPNNEVRVGLSDSLLPLLSNYEKKDTDMLIARFKRAVRADDLATARELLYGYFAGIHNRVLEDKGEHTYHAIFYTLFSLLGFAPKIENGCARGYSDMIFETPTSVYCMEFKVDRSAAEALRQIEERGYLEPFVGKGKRLVMVGVNFSTKERNIAEWEEVPFRFHAR